MVLTAQPLPPDVHDPDPRTIDDLVIKEAKQRARRRRRRYGLVAAGMTAAVSASVFVTLDRTPPSRGSATAAPTTAGSTTARSFGVCLSPGQVPNLSAPTRGGPPAYQDGGPAGYISGPVTDPRPGGAPCRLVLWQYSHGNFGASRLGTVKIFSDGRVISSVSGEFYTRPKLVERQLTTEGVERVRSMAVSLLTDVPPAPRSAPSGGLMPEAQIYYQGRNHWSSDFAKLSDTLFLLAWLPDAAWLRKEPQPYQPNWWDACYRGAGHAVDRQRLLDRLPADAAAVLRDKETVTSPSSWEDGLGTHETVMHCTVISTAERQVIVQALHAAGYAMEGNLLGRIDVSPVELVSNPLLPDGDSSTYGG